MINSCFDDSLFIFDQSKKAASRKQQNGILENQDGNIMFVAEAILITLEEENMDADKDPHIKIPLTFKAAMWLGLGFIGIALAGAWAMYTHLDNKLEAYRSGTETKIEASRQLLDAKIDTSSKGLEEKISLLGTVTNAHFEASRVETKADNAAIMSQLNEVSKNLSEINGKLSK